MKWEVKELLQQYTQGRLVALLTGGANLVPEGGAHSSAGKRDKVDMAASWERTVVWLSHQKLLKLEIFSFALRGRRTHPSSQGAEYPLHEEMTGWHKPVFFQQDLKAHLILTHYLIIQLSDYKCMNCYEVGNVSLTQAHLSFILTCL